MTYFGAFLALSGLFLAWCVFRLLHRRRSFFRKQDRLSSSFARSQATRTHGPGAQGITQNILIANLAATPRRMRGDSA